MSQIQKNSPIFARFGQKYGVDGNELSTILKATAFKLPRTKRGQDYVEQVISDEQMAALLIVAEQFRLNPFTKEIYAFPDKAKGIIPIVSVDGWGRIVNEHPQCDGVDFKAAENIITLEDAKPCPEWIEAIFYRKDRTHPIVVREYLDECYRAPFVSDRGGKTIGPWQTHTKRFLRHKAFIQGARLAFGFSGIYDEDEGQRIAEARVVSAQEHMAAPIDVGTDKTLALPPSEQFERILLDMGINDDRRPMVEVYVNQCAKHFGADRAHVIEQIVSRPDEFRRSFPGWEKSYAVKHQPPAQSRPAPVEVVNPETGEVAMEQSALLTHPSSDAPKKGRAATIGCPKSGKPVPLSKCDKCPERAGCPEHESAQDVPTVENSASEAPADL